MVLRRISVIAGLALLCASFAVSSAGARSQTTERLTAVESQIVREINRVRVARGLHVLAVSPGLRIAAVGHSRSMLDEGFFDHTSPDGTAAGERIARSYAQRPHRPWMVGETLFATAGVLTARESVAQWLASPAHREILLDPKWRELGIGVARSTGVNGIFGDAPASVATADFGTR